MISVYKYGETPDSEIFARTEQSADVAGAVSDIIAEVRRSGDAALRAYSESFDRVSLSAIEVGEDEITAAKAAVGTDFYGVLERSAANIRAFHTMQLREGFRIEKRDGVILGQKITPIGRVGVYVPGGSAPLASTVLMDIIPAKLAGCPEIIMCTPPRRDGSVDPAVLAAAKLAGADRIFRVGGAQAIAAMAYGTETVPRADKIVGPGNAYVAEAKRQVFGQVSIDMIAGPSEILIIADGECDPRCVAADMLSQAEHDRLASAVLVTDSERLAAGVSAELERQLTLLPRCEIARASIEANGKIIIAPDIGTAIKISNRLAPEHLEVCVDDPMRYLPEIVNAGSVFLGRNCPEALGDYYAGPNHTLPTGGTARFSSPLSVDDFIKKTSYTYYTESALDAACADIAAFARREGLDAHAYSVTVRHERK